MRFPGWAGGGWELEGSASVVVEEECIEKDDKKEGVFQDQVET